MQRLCHGPHHSNRRASIGSVAVSPPGAQRQPQADLARALGDRHEHDVHHAVPPTISDTAAMASGSVCIVLVDRVRSSTMSSGVRTRKSSAAPGQDAVFHAEHGADVLGHVLRHRARSPGRDPFNNLNNLTPNGLGGAMQTSQRLSSSYCRKRRRYTVAMRSPAARSLLV
jgi:hypothetical protein